MKFVRIGVVTLIGGILILAAIGKLLDNRHFAETLAKWQLFPRWSLLPLGVVTSLSELLLAAWLLSGWRLRLAAIGAILFHLGYTAATIITLLRGVRLSDCGYFGIFFPHPLNWTMALEDLGFAGLSFVLYLIAHHDHSARW
ncbi:MAG: hypothetical protein QOH24_2077 [Verrucomicrobiota bacterium]|jgi:uncharacterized membrane protein YphA (DoxX/SURF4 family)